MLTGFARHPRKWVAANPAALGKTAPPSARLPYICPHTVREQENRDARVGRRPYFVLLGVSAVCLVVTALVM
jgi:hypothetical protein